MVLINIEAERNPKEQFEKYMQTVKLVRNQVECVVSTSLRGLDYWKSKNLVYQLDTTDYIDEQTRRYYKSNMFLKN